MGNIVETMSALPDFYPGSSASAESVKQAEEQLGVTFAEDYRQYVRALGDASTNGHELTGVTDIERLNVVGVTLVERKRNPDVPASFYVIEQTHVDRIAIWQDEQGFIYQAMPGGRPEMVCKSLGEYVAS